MQPIRYMVNENMLKQNVKKCALKLTRFFLIVGLIFLSIGILYLPYGLVFGNKDAIRDGSLALVGGAVFLIYFFINYSVIKKTLTGRFYYENKDGVIEYELSGERGLYELKNLTHGTTKKFYGQFIVKIMQIENVFLITLKGGRCLMLPAYREVVSEFVYQQNPPQNTNR